MARARFGDRRTCERCDLDIEFHGSRAGWIDRGGNVLCPSTNLPRLHRPLIFE